MRAQRYVSKELTHFAGRAKASAHEQYDTLASILESGKLLHPYGKDNPLHVYTWSPRGSLTRHDMFWAGCVCFCDIPVDDLEIHTSKYSRFGLSFLKTDLLAKGATPVFYVAKDALPLSPWVTETKTNAEFFDQEGVRLTRFFRRTAEVLQDHFGVAEAQEGTPAETMPPELGDLMAVQSFVGLLLAYMKFFDGKTTDEDPENFYMEREWRIYGNLEFDIADVYRVFLPREYASRFRADFPGYLGQLSFV